MSIIRFQKWLVADFFFVDRLLRYFIFGQIEIIGMPPFPIATTNLCLIYDWCYLLEAEKSWKKVTTETAVAKDKYSDWVTLKKRSMSSMLEYVKVNHARSCESVTCILWNFEPSGNPMQSAFFSREKCGTYTFHETDDIHDIQRFYNIYWSWNALSWVGQLAIAYQEIRGSNLYWILYHEISCNGLYIRTLK